MKGGPKNIIITDSLSKMDGGYHLLRVRDFWSLSLVVVLIIDVREFTLFDSEANVLGSPDNVSPTNLLPVGESLTRDRHTISELCETRWLSTY